MIVLACAILTGCGMRSSVTVTKKGKLADDMKAEYLLSKEELESLKEQMPDYIAKLSNTEPVKYDGVSYYAADADEFAEEYGKVIASQMGDEDVGEFDDDDDWDDDDWDDDWDDDDWDSDWDDDDLYDEDSDGDAIVDEYAEPENDDVSEPKESVDPADFVVTKKKFVYKYIPSDNIDKDDSNQFTPYILRVTMPKPIGKTNGKIDPNDPCTVEFNIKLTKKGTYNAKVAKKAK